MSDVEKALTAPCPGCYSPAGVPCRDIETGATVSGVHANRVYRAYVVAEADAHNRAVELAAEVERLRAVIDEVRGLHVDSPAGFCPSCGRLSDVSDIDDGLVAYPCPTIRALPALELP